MDNAGLKEKVLKIVSNAEIIEDKQYLTVNVPQNKLHTLAQSLKEDEETKFDYLFCLTGMDYEDSLGVVYHITSSVYNHIIVLKIKTPNREKPEFESVTDIWKTAEFHEREVFDLFGINFKNHPDMRRIFLESYFKGYPLRKDFVDEINIIER